MEDNRYIPEHDDSVPSYDRIVKYAGVFGGVQGLVTLITVVRTKIVSWILGIAGFGINTIFNNTINQVKSTTDLGLAFSAVKHISDCMNQTDTAYLQHNILVVRSWALITAIVGTLLCVVLSPFFCYIGFDSDWSYTVSFAMLSPSVGFAAVNGTEMAILKGTRNLKKVALSQLVTVIVMFFISVPILFFMGIQGLVPSIVLVSLASMCVTCGYSFRLYPYRVSLFSKQIFRDGFGMVKLGIFYTIAAFFGACSASAVTYYLMNRGDAEITGSYGAGTLLVSYLGMLVFASMESDYYPRLSTVSSDREKVNLLVNSQVEVATLMMTPMVAAFLLFLPMIVPLFLKHEFVRAIPMTQLAVLSLSFKAVVQPVAYISLAKGDSKTFLLQELLYDVFIVIAVIGCFVFGGLKWIGLGILLAGVFDLISVWLITSSRYGFNYSVRAVRLFIIQFPVLLLSYLLTVYTSGMTYWIGGMALMGLSAYISIYYIRKYTTFLNTLLCKIKNRLRHE